MNFLIIVYKGIGDIVLTTPLIKVIKHHFPQSTIYFLAKKHTCGILKNNPFIEKVLIKDELEIAELRSLKIDVAMDFMHSTSSAFYSFVSGAKMRIAMWKWWNFVVFNYRIKSEWDGYNVVKRFEYLEPFGINPFSIKDIKPEVYPSSSDLEKVKKILEDNKAFPGKDKIVNMDITSPRAYRQLDGEKFMYIADRLIEKGFKTIFIPSPSEYDYVKNTINNYSRYSSNHIIISGLNLIELAALISKVNLHIGTSSGPMHIAVSFNIPTFTIYSPFTNPQAWGPPLKIHGYIQGELDKLKKEEIWEKIDDFIKENNI